MRGWMHDVDKSSQRRTPYLRPCGLDNEGNSCYFNALIQTFFHVSPVFRAAVIALVPDGSHAETRSQDAQKTSQVDSESTPVEKTSGDPTLNEQFSDEADAYSFPKYFFFSQPAASTIYRTRRHRTPSPPNPYMDSMLPCLGDADDVTSQAVSATRLAAHNTSPSVSWFRPLPSAMCPPQPLRPISPFGIFSPQYEHWMTRSSFPSVATRSPSVQQQHSRASSRKAFSFGVDAHRYPQPIGGSPTYVIRRRSPSMERAHHPQMTTQRWMSHHETTPDAATKKAPVIAAATPPGNRAQTRPTRVPAVAPESMLRPRQRRYSAETTTRYVPSWSYYPFMTFVNSNAPSYNTPGMTPPVGFASPTTSPHHQPQGSFGSEGSRARRVSMSRRRSEQRSPREPSVCTETQSTTSENGALSQLPPATHKSLYGGAVSPCGGSSTHDQRNTSSQDARDGRWRTQSESPAVLVLLKKAFVAMMFSLRASVSIFDLYECVMGRDVSQQDTVEIRGRFFQLIRQCAEDLAVDPDAADPAVAEHKKTWNDFCHLMRRLFTGTVGRVRTLRRRGVGYFYEALPGEEPRRLEMDFFQLEATLTTDTVLGKLLRDMTYGARGRVYFTPPEILCINLNRFCCLEATRPERSLSDATFRHPDTRRTSTRRRVVSRRMTESPQPLIITKRQCSCCFPETLCIQDLLPPDSDLVLRVHPFEEEVLEAEKKYQANVQALDLLTRGECDSSSDMEALTDQQELLRHALDTAHQQLQAERFHCGMLYRLQAVVLHRGEPTAGHYWLYVRCPNGNGLVWYRLDDHQVSIASFAYMCSEAVGLSADVAQWNQRTIQQTFWGNSLSETEWKAQLSDIKVKYEEQQHYTKRDGRFDACPFLLEPPDIPASLVAAYSLFYVRARADSNMEDAMGLGARLAHYIPRYRDLAVMSDWAFVTTVCSRDVVDPLIQQNCQLLLPLATSLVHALEPLSQTAQSDITRLLQTALSVDATSDDFHILLQSVFNKWKHLLPYLPHELSEPFSSLLIRCLVQVFHSRYG